MRRRSIADMNLAAGKTQQPTVARLYRLMESGWNWLHAGHGKYIHLVVNAETWEIIRIQRKRGTPAPKKGMYTLEDITWDEFKSQPYKVDIIC